MIGTGQQSECDYRFHPIYSGSKYGHHFLKTSASTKAWVVSPLDLPAPLGPPPGRGFNFLSRPCTFGLPLPRGALCVFFPTVKTLSRQPGPTGCSLCVHNTPGPHSPVEIRGGRSYTGKGSPFLALPFSFAGRTALFYFRRSGFCLIDQANGQGRYCRCSIMIARPRSPSRARSGLSKKREPRRKRSPPDRSLFLFQLDGPLAALTHLLLVLELLVSLLVYGSGQTLASGRSAGEN